MTATRLPFPEPARPPQDDPGALVDWARLRDRLRFAGRAVRRHPVLATACFLAIAALGPLSLAVMPRTYHVEAVVKASRNAVVSPLAEPVLLRSFDADDPANLARDAILRRDSLAAIARETGLLDRAAATQGPLTRVRAAAADLLVRYAEAHPSLGLPWTRERARERRAEAVVDALEKRLSISVPGAQPGAAPGAPKDRVVIAVDWSDAQVAKDLVEAAARRFFDGRREAEQSMGRDAAAVLEARAAAVRKDIEAKVTRIHGLEVAMLRGTPALSRTYRAPHGRVPQEEELAQLRVTLEARKVALADEERLATQRASDVRAELARERTVYGDRHPIIARTREVLERVSAPSPRAAALRAEIAGLEQQFQRASERAARLVDDEDPALEYERTDLRLLLAQYTTLQNRLDGARIESAIADAGFDRRYAFAVPPVLPRKAEWPKPLLSIAAGLLGGLLLAFFAAAAVDARSSRVVDRWQLERRLRLPVLGEVTG